MPTDISAVARAGKTLWLVSDEGAWLDRMVEIAPNHFGHRKRLPLDDIFRPAGAGEKDDKAPLPGAEMDLEGLAIDGQEGGPLALWLVGSHATTRKDPRPETAKRKKALKRLAAVERPVNRFFLGRLPLAKMPDGSIDIQPRQEAADGPGPQMLDFDRDDSLIVRLLRKDPHLGPFISLPSKENGLDIEGIAVRGERVFLGCRGPVLRGYAVIIELALSPGDHGLEAGKVEKGRRYRKFFLPLDGLGTRALLLDGEDMLILAGPTMPVGVPARIYRWHGALAREKSAVIPASEVELLGDLPAHMDDDRPEAIEHWPSADGRRALLVVHDTPAPGRIDRIRKTIQADVIGLDDPPRQVARPDGDAPVGANPPHGADARSDPGDQQGREFTIAEGVKVRFDAPRTSRPEEE
jgi:hypothetical protein